MIINCDSCKTPFSKCEAHAKRSKKNYCSISCYRQTIARIKTTCEQCKIEISKTKSGYDCSDKHFCGKRCAAIFNNTCRRIGRKRSKKCKTCDALIKSGWKYCDDCILQKKHIKNPLDPTKSLGYYRSKCKDQNKYRYIRIHAKQVTAKWKKECTNCRYSIHVETCHIKEISDFPDTALMGEINDIRNLLILCRNCHWEFDHIMTEETRNSIHSIQLGALGLEPRT